ncbi:Hypothetical protein FKW44_023607, partial [Caligus rogercresseyi]
FYRGAIGVQQQQHKAKSAKSGHSREPKMLTRNWRPAYNDFKYITSLRSKHLNGPLRRVTAMDRLYCFLIIDSGF